MSTEVFQKKLKQGRLPFTPVDPKSQKKRRLSSEEKLTKAAKVLRSETEVTPSKETPLSPKSPPSNPLREECNEFPKENKKILEEKENLQNANTEISLSKDEPLSREDTRHGPVDVMENSNDSIEVILVKGSESSREKASQAVKVPKVHSHASPRIPPCGSGKKRKRSCSSKKSSKNSPMAIDKLFKNIETKKEETASKLPKKNTLKTSYTEKNVDISDSLKESYNLKTAVISIPRCTQKGASPEKLNDSKNSSDLNNSDVEESLTSSTTSSPPLSQEKNDNEAESKKQSETSPRALESPINKVSSSKKRKLTPGQLKKNEELKRKKEEKERLKREKEEEKEKVKKEKEEEKQKLKEEKMKKKMEELEAKEKEKEEKRLKKVEERIKKEEEKQKKEEEKQKKEEEKLMAEEEEREKREKRKAEFAKFFVPKKPESASLANEAENNVPGNFILFQVKDNMRVAPLVRSNLSQEQKEALDQAVNPDTEVPSTVNYLEELKSGNYFKGKSPKTFPPVEKVDDDDCEILSDDGEDIDGTDVLEEKKKVLIQKAKLFQFCENRRPAYHGTWSKKPHHINGRRPFAREEVFDYDYDSDEDWEEIETGESLSDSEGEGEDAGEEELNQYEVDNDFFVPHGYLSDGEGEEDQENVEEGEDNSEEKDKDETKQKEKLKQKQEEFELEMKQKTKQLKPKVFGCVWVGEEDSHPAYNQLVKILSPYRAMVLFGTTPINMDTKDPQLPDSKDGDEDEEDATKKFVKSFPERAIPDLIRLIHGNHHSKLFLIREFNAYWKKKLSESNDDDGNAGGCIAMRKIEPKIQEIGQYGRFSEGGISLRRRTWYVSKEIRAKYGLEDLSLKNSWTYTIPPRESKQVEVKEDEEAAKGDETPEHSFAKPPVKSSATNLITKFTKVLTGEEEKKKSFGSASQGSSESDTGGPVTPKTPGSSEVFDTPSPSASGKKGKMKAKGSPMPNIVQLFKNVDKKKNCASPTSGETDFDCITLD